VPRSSELQRPVLGVRAPVKAPTLVAEEFAFQQPAWNRRTIEFHHRSLATATA
jgi:hypothetical protein